MGISVKKLAERRSQRQRFRVKSCSKGRPRLSVFCSNRQIYAQIIDDLEGRTIASASTLEKEFSTKSKKGGPSKEKAALIGKMIAERARKSGTEKVVFDRGRYEYHGVVSSLAEAAREGGLNF
jgi:large subunit ribosomal protein L18